MGTRGYSWPEACQYGEQMESCTKYTDVVIENKKGCCPPLKLCCWREGRPT